MDGCVSSFEAYKLCAHAVRFSSSDSVEGEFRFTLYSFCVLVFVQGIIFIVEKEEKIAFYY